MWTPAGRVMRMPLHTAQREAQSTWRQDLDAQITGLPRFLQGQPDGDGTATY
jgi:hypothetical protein